MEDINNHSSVENNVNDQKKSNKPLLLLSAISFLLLLSSAYFAYRLYYAKDTTKSDSNSYIVDLNTDSLKSLKSDDNLKILTINDISDDFSNKKFNIPEWELSITTKYADMLEYKFIDKSKALGGYCEGDYFVCSSILQVLIKEKYIDMAKEDAKDPYGYNRIENEDAKLDDRTVAYIYQDNVNKSQGGSELYRLWSTDKFKTEYGNTGTLIFNKTTAGGIDEYGKAYCGVELNVNLKSKTPCEEIFSSLYKFEATKL